MENEAGDFLPVGVTVEGRLFSHGPLTLAGTVTGCVTCEGPIAVTGRVNGRITAPQVQITGSVEGDIAVSGAVRISEGARVTGDIEAEILSAQGPGALSGHLSIGPERLKAGEEALAAFMARVTARFPPRDSGPTLQEMPSGKVDEIRQLKLKDAADKLRAQKNRNKK